MENVAEETVWKLRSRSLVCGPRSLVMGILNVTPDSFSDGGRFASVSAAIERGVEMADQGADILDIGGESTRPYSQSISSAEEIDRVLPVIEGISSRVDVPISIDTSKSTVARLALNAGAEIINDVTGLESDPQMIQVATETGAGVCVMHMQGTPQTMQDSPSYENVVKDIYSYLQMRLNWCLNHGIERERICLDPGIGFGKTHEHNLTLLRHIREFLELGQPLLVGHSRKGFIAHVLGDKTIDRMAGTLGVSLALAAAGVHVLRVHDVAETVQALKLFSTART